MHNKGVSALLKLYKANKKLESDPIKQAGMGLAIACLEQRKSELKEMRMQVPPTLPPTTGVEGGSEGTPFDVDDDSEVQNYGQPVPPPDSTPPPSVRPGAVPSVVVRVFDAKILEMLNTVSVSSSEDTARIILALCEARRLYNSTISVNE
jgi:hypothetical protein